MPDFFGGDEHASRSDPYFAQKRQREAEFIAIPNTIKEKVGSGGLDVHILTAAQKIIEKNDTDFLPHAQRHLYALREGIRLTQTQRNRFDIDGLLATIAQPALQLKANGSMFGYPLITHIADLMIRFLEVINDLDDDALALINGFGTALNAVIIGNMRGSGGEDGQNLYRALEEACQRYFDKQHT